jgi:hypothetical protein
LRLVALIEAPPTVARILRHLGPAAELPVARPARAPPREAAVDGHGGDDAAAFDDE